MKCSKCGADFEGKFCPECGAKVEENAQTTQEEVRSDKSRQAPTSFDAKLIGRSGKTKKPIYKRWWFIVVAIFVVLGIYATVTRDSGNKSEKIKWSEIILKDYIPEPPSTRGHIYTNSDESLSVDLDKVSDAEYNTYMNECIDMGYTIDAQKLSTWYEAYNADGYSLRISHASDGLSINLDAPMQMSTISWPSGTAGGLIPAPESSTGKFSYEYDKEFFVYVGDTSKADYDAYVTTCSDSGFTIDYEKDDDYYRAYNADGYSVTLRYEGNNIMSIKVAHPDEESTEVLENTTDGTTEVEISDEQTQTESKTITEAETEASTEEVTEETVASGDGISTDFKEAMDSYESFMNEYCDFMEKYSANPSDPTLLIDYASYTSKYASMVADFDKWNSENMTDEELVYYMEVQTRVTARLLEVGAN